ncbi:G0/G1 switch protein 2-like [Osmerus mordax]|uniref:G0/G1 switch protein 2-like n=1 Tax=Osmerus mordax TaxID=8014 RepID=UPI003510A593
METIHEIIPFAKEMLRQKPNRSMLKLYLIGSVVATLGTVLGLMDTVCNLFSFNEPLDAELAQLMVREQKLLETEEKQRKTELEVGRQGGVAKEVTQPKEQKETVVQRNAANRLHAS